MTSGASVSRVNLLIRGGYVLTMDAAGDIPGGDVHLQDGIIQSIGMNLDVPEAELVDASGKIVAPGLVDTHWHLWNTLLRGMSDGLPSPDGPGSDRGGYFLTCAGVGRHFLPDDTYAATRLAAAEALPYPVTDFCWPGKGYPSPCRNTLIALFKFKSKTAFPQPGTP